jgi:FAD/FMN-containing dehydrogenase
MFDPLYPAGLQWYWRADFFKHYSDEAIEQHVKYAAQLPTAYSAMHIYPVNGAAGRAGSQDTAWAYRDANFAQVIVAVDPDPVNNASMIAWAKDYSSALQPYSAGGAYVNMIMDEGEERVKAAYRDNYARLAQIKAAVDPTNFFHVNQNIKPAR